MVNPVYTGFTRRFYTPAMKRTVLAVAGSTALVAGLALAQSTTGGMDHTQMGGASAGSAMKMGGTTDLSGLAKLSGKPFDRAFLSMMIPHHQAALEMARAVLPTTKDATLKTWATAVITNQTREINLMTSLLPALGGTDQAMAGTMKSSMSVMGNAVRTPKQGDQTFVQDMLPHHASALDMAQLALEKSSDPQVLKLARDIVTAQAREMYDFRVWLVKRGL